MKVEFSLYLDVDKKEILIQNHPFVLEQLISAFPEGGYLDGSAELPFKWRTKAQHGYLFTEIGEKAKMGYRAQGKNVKDKFMAIALLMLEEEIDCTDKIIDAFSGDVIARVPKRISAMSRRDLNEFMSSAILFIETELGVTVQTPEEYKELKKLK